MKVYLATDHAGFELKEKVKKFLIENGYQFEDCGALSFDPSDDYPDFISKASLAVSQDPENSKGIVFGGSGQAEAMVANKFKNIRCAVFYTPIAPREAVDITGRKSSDPFEIIRLTREHNNANMLSIGARFVTKEEANLAVKIWLDTTFKNEERHARRLRKIKEIELD